MLERTIWTFVLASGISQTFTLNSATLTQELRACSWQVYLPERLYSCRKQEEPSTVPTDSQHQCFFSQSLRKRCSVTRISLVSTTQLLVLVLAFSARSFGLYIWSTFSFIRFTVPISIFLFVKQSFNSLKYSTLRGFLHWIISVPRMIPLHLLQVFNIIFKIWRADLFPISLHQSHLVITR